jgi:hypothetical protein
VIADACHNAALGLADVVQGNHTSTAPANSGRVFRCA